MMDKNLCALNPPRGWNSWDCYGAAVTEEILKKNADYIFDNNEQKNINEINVLEILQKI